MRHPSRALIQVAQRRMNEIERLGVDTQATPWQKGEAVAKAARFRRLRELDAALSLVAVAPPDDFLSGCALDLDALLESRPAHSPRPAPSWLARRQIGRPKHSSEPYAPWLELTAKEAATRDVRYIVGPSHVVAALLQIVASERSSNGQSRCWPRLSAIQVSDSGKRLYTSLFQVHTGRVVPVIEIARTPHFGVVAIAGAEGDLALLLDRGLFFHLSAMTSSLELLQLDQARRGSTYELRISSPSEGLFAAATDIVLQCTSEAPLRFIRSCVLHRNLDTPRPVDETPEQIDAVDGVAPR